MILKTARFAVLVSLCVLAIGPATAGDRVGMGVKVGTYGLGLDFGVKVINPIGFRLSLARAEISIDSLSVEDVEYDGDLTLGGEGLLLDIYPTGGKFRITAGVYSNRNEIDLASTPTQPVRIGDNIYTPAEVGTLFGTVTFDDVAPYVGVGWGNVARSKGARVRFLIDVGVLAQDSGQVDDLMSSTGLVSDNDLALESAAIEDEIADYDLWPMVNVGIAINF